MENNDRIHPESLKDSPFADSPFEMNFSDTPQTPETPAQETPTEDTPSMTDEPVEESQPEETDDSDFLALVSKEGKRTRHRKILFTCLASILIVAMIVTGCGVTAYYMAQRHVQDTNQLIQVINRMNQKILSLQQEIEDNSFTGNGNSISGTPVPTDGLTPGQVHAQNRNSVVAIANQGVTTNIFGQTTETASAGSGFVISEDGYIVTNYHVIEGATTLTVITNNEDEYPATVVGYDEQNDFALIKVETSGWTPVKLGSSDDLIVGDQVVAIGNPLGEITNSLTVGYISVKDRDVTIEGSIINMLQTDAAINPGNSGGPLFNMKGEVIGITTAKYADEAVEGISFAIPIDDVADMINELLEDGYISAPYLGVQVTDAADGVGVYVYSVEADSPAAKAGLKKGDVILAVGDYETSELAQLSKVLRNFEPDETATIQVLRNRQVIDLTITFGSKYQPAN
ncbi:MAG: trypsin-like serine protease [Ruminococcaceae bacterium]|nr:trypsin-like serine protease [Oscillospiraceae bacterium]